MIIINKVKYFISAALTVAFLTAGVAVFPNNNTLAAVAAEDLTMLETEKTLYEDYIISLMLDNGAVAKTKPAAGNYNAVGLPDAGGVAAGVYTKWTCADIIPYFSQNAMLGFLKTNPQKAKPHAEAFINWYFDHMNTAQSDFYGVDGTVFDYYAFIDPNDRSNIIEVPKRSIDPNADYDSTDSYAACAIQLLDYYQAAFGSLDVFGDRKNDIDRLYNAIMATYRDNLGLTYAKPSYEVCYLMDNCEVYNGLISGERLMREEYNDVTAADKFADAAEKIKNGIEKYMWNGEKNEYYPAVFLNGKPDKAVDWSVWYADATCQLFPVLFGLIEPSSDRAVFLYDKFNSFFKNSNNDWTILKKNDDFPWAITARAAAVMDDGESCLKFVETMKSKFSAKSFPYPMYNQEAGQTLAVIDYLIENVDKIPNESSDITQSRADSEASAGFESDISRDSETSHPSEDTNSWFIPALILGAAAVTAGIVLGFKAYKKAKKTM